MTNNMDILQDMVDSLKMASEAESKVVDGYAYLMKQPLSVNADSMELRRRRVALEAASNRRRFECEAAALDWAITKLRDTEGEGL